MEQMITGRTIDIAAKYESACHLAPMLAAKDANPFQEKEKMAPPAGAIDSGVSVLD